MHIMTADGWKPLQVKSSPAPRERSMIEDFNWWKPGIKAGDIAARYIAGSTA